MKYHPLTLIPEVVGLEPSAHEDHRGSFMETFRQDDFALHCGGHVFVQDNSIRSTEGVLRGLHYNPVHPQGKLVRATQGEVFDVAVDMRKDSPTYGQWVGAILSSTNKCQLWVPPYFAHGFITLSSYSEVVYKATDYYQEGEVCLKWDDEDLGINWLLDKSNVTVSEKDANGLSFKNAPSFSF